MYEIDNWQEICIEVMKSVHGYEKEDYNRKLKCTDYTKNSEGVQLFRVPKRQGNTVKIDLNFWKR